MYQEDTTSGQIQIALVVPAPWKGPVALKDGIETETRRKETKQTEPTDWLNCMVEVTKPNGPTGSEYRHQERALPAVHRRILTKDKESSHLGTFSTPFGRYRVKRSVWDIDPKSCVTGV